MYPSAFSCVRALSKKPLTEQGCITGARGDDDPEALPEGPAPKKRKREAADLNDFVNQKLEESARSIVIDTLPQALQIGIDVEERPAWGLDCFTYKYETFNLVSHPHPSSNHITSGQLKHSWWMGWNWHWPKELLILEIVTFIRALEDALSCYSSPGSARVDGKSFVSTRLLRAINRRAEQGWWVTAKWFKLSL